MTAYYNEYDKRAAAWITELINAGQIAPGIVDTRSIEDVRPDDLRGFTQCHFFAGIGVWSYALRRAGWPDDRRVWTGSCPCQPFSAAGKGAGFTDERHLWPAWYHLITQCRPDDVFGEQVASKDGLAWLDVVHADLEAAFYAVWAQDLCAAGVGAPHIRQRLFFVADGKEFGWHERRGGLSKNGQDLVTTAHLAAWQTPLSSDGQVTQGRSPEFLKGRTLLSPVESLSAWPDGGGHASLGLADSSSTRLEVGERDGRIQRQALVRPEGQAALGNGDAGRLAYDDDDRRGSCRQPIADGAQRDVDACGSTDGAGSLHGHWDAADWLLCTDGRWRPVEPGSFPLAHGAPARVGRLRGYGNAIVAQAAQAFIRSYLEGLNV